MPADFPSTAMLLSAGATLLSWGATYLLHSTALLAGVWLWLRLRPATLHAAREMLWKVALVGGVMTTAAQLVLGVSGPIGRLTVLPPAAVRSGGSGPASDRMGQVTQRPVGDANVERTAADDPAGHVSPDREVWLIADTEPGGFAAAAGAISTPSSAVQAGHRAGLRKTAASGSTHPRSTWGIWAFFGIAFSSIALGLCRCVGQTVSLHRRLADATPIRHGLARGLLDDLCLVVPGTPCVRLLSAPHCSEPAAFGLRHWTIVLPERAERDLSEDELRSLLAHELAHLVRGDNWWLFLSRLVCSCCGFQPLNHLARREWQRAAEHLCDAWAVSRTGSRLALARCLAEVAGWRWSRAECAASLAATGRRSGLSDRIERLLADEPLSEPWRESRSRRVLVLVGGTALAGLIGFGPRISLSSAGSEAIASAAAAERRAPASADSPAPLSPSAPMEGDDAMLVEMLEQFDAEYDAARLAADLRNMPPATAALFAALDNELQDLEGELARLRPLLERVDAPPEARNLAESLRHRLEQLGRRRDVLARLLQEPPAATAVEREFRSRAAENQQPRDAAARAANRSPPAAGEKSDESKVKTRQGFL